MRRRIQGQINISPRADKPRGRRRYRPIYERAEALVLPLGIHLSGYDMRIGQSWFDPKRVKIRSYLVAVERGEELGQGLYVAATLPVHVEGQLRDCRGLNTRFGL